MDKQSWESKGPTPPNATSPKKQIRPCAGMMVLVNSPLIRPYFLGEGGIFGAPLDFNDSSGKSRVSQTHVVD